jgi:predicted Kef-type K+ transport protein
MVLLGHAAIFLATAVVVVPLFRRLKLGAVLGYLAAGALIGPWGLGMIGDAEATLSFAELGVVLLLFLVGLELEPSRLWALRQPVFGLGSAQVLVTGIALTVIVHGLDFSWQAATVIGFGASGVLPLRLGEFVRPALLSRRCGFPMSATLSSVLLSGCLCSYRLSTRPARKAADTGGERRGRVVLVIVVSRMLIRPALKLIARFGGREVFTAAALRSVIGAALLMRSACRCRSARSGGRAGFEFRTTRGPGGPFKGLLMGLFFMAVGMSANLRCSVRIRRRARCALGMMALKALLLYGIMRAAKRRRRSAGAGRRRICVRAVHRGAGHRHSRNRDLAVPRAGGDHFDAAGAAHVRRP